MTDNDAEGNEEETKAAPVADIDDPDLAPVTEHIHEKPAKAPKVKNTDKQRPSPPPTKKEKRDKKKGRK